MISGDVRYAILVVATTVIPTSVIAQGRWDRQVQERLDRATAAVSSRLPVMKQSGALNTDESASFQAPLIQGRSYAILAVCDDDCTRLELTLVTPSGSELAKERHSESFPTLQFTAQSTMTYRVRVLMEECRWNPCHYAVAVVPKGRLPVAAR